MRKRNAHAALLELTHDWDDQDWDIATEYVQLLVDAPAARPDIEARAKHRDDVGRFNAATLLLHDAWEAQAR